MILDTLLKCLMMDGKWPSDVTASAFVGGDVIHVDNRIQEVVMPLFKESDGSEHRTPATVHRWEETLWENRGIDQPGLKWLQCMLPLVSFQAAQTRVIDNVKALLNEDHGSVFAFLLSHRWCDATYEELKAAAGAGSHCSSEVSKVYVLLGGAHGFDGLDDKDPSFMHAVAGCFRHRFGPQSISYISLSEQRDSHVKLTSAKIASFISVEWARGALQHVIAGAEQLSARPPQAVNGTQAIGCVTVGHMVDVPLGRLALWATVLVGLEFVAVEEIRRKVSGDVKVLEELPGRILFTLPYRRPSEIRARLESIRRLSSIERVYAHAFQVALKLQEHKQSALETFRSVVPLERHRNAMSRAVDVWREWCSLCGHEPAENITFRCTGQRTGRHDFNSLELAQALAEGVHRAFGWGADLVSPDMEIFGHLRYRSLHFSVSLTQRGHRAWGENDSVTQPHDMSVVTCRPTLYYAICMAAGLPCTFSGPCGAVCDPLCGDNMICEALSISEFGSHCFCLSGDISKVAVDKAATRSTLLTKHRNCQMDFCRWDARRLPIRPGVLDFILSDLLFGRHHRTENIKQSLSPHIIREMARCLQPCQARCVVLVSKRELKRLVCPVRKPFSPSVESLAGSVGEANQFVGWKVASQHMLSHGALPCCLCTLEKEQLCCTDKTCQPPRREFHKVVGNLLEDEHAVPICRYIHNARAASQLAQRAQ